MLTELLYGMGTVENIVFILLNHIYLSITFEQT